MLQLIKGVELLDRLTVCRPLNGVIRFNSGMVDTVTYPSQWRKHQNWLSSLFALVFWNEMHHRLADVCIIAPPITLQCIMFTKMVKIGPVVFELKWVENKNCAATRTKFDDFRSFSILAFWNGLEYHNFDFSRLIGNHFYTSCEILVRFGLVIPEF